MTASATWDATLGDTAVEKGTELDFKAGKRRIDQLSARHHHDIERGTWLVMAEQLANSAFGQISHHSAAHLSRCRDAQSWRRLLGSSQEYQHVASADLEAFLVGGLEVCATLDMFGRAQSLAHALLRDCERLSLVRDGQPFATLGPPALEYVLTVLGCHANQKTVRALASPVVRLKCTFSLCH
jgi:hypothetical protein